MRFRGLVPCIFLAHWALMGERLDAQKVNDFPSKSDPLHVKAEKYDAINRGNHWNEGTIIPNVIFPPVGKEIPIVGSQEDCAFHTGGYLATLSYRYAVTKDEEVRKLADQVMVGILKLEKVTGQSGCVARSFNKTDKPNPHEEWFFFPMEWHGSKTMPGYRWEGDLSSDQFTGLIYGAELYWELCADDVHKKIAADFVDRLVGRCVDNDFRIVDSDNKMTLWGNFCPDLPHENMNALLILSHLKTAFRMTGNDRYAKAYDFLIKGHHYDDEAILAKVLWPAEHRNTSDDELAAMALFHLIRFEDDPSLLQKYRMSLNRHWFLWKKDHQVFYDMLYQVLTGEKTVDEKTLKMMSQARTAWRRRATLKVPPLDETDEIRVTAEEDATWYLRDYWMGRYYKFFDEKM